MKQQSLKSLIKAVSLISKSNSSERGISTAVKIGLLVSMFGLPAQQVLAGEITVAQFVESLGNAADSATKEKIVDLLNQLLELQANEQTLDQATSLELAGVLVPLANEAGIDQSELEEMLQDLGVSPEILAAIKPELMEEYIDARVYTAQANSETATDAAPEVAADAPEVQGLVGASVVASPISVALGGVLAAVGLSGGSSAGAAASAQALTAKGVVANAPLGNAQFFYDANNNGVFDEGDIALGVNARTGVVGRTNDDGSFDLTAGQIAQITALAVRNGSFVAKAIAGETLDGLTGRVLSSSDTILKAADPGGSNLNIALTPFTTLMNSGLSADAIRSLFNLQPGVDLSTYNPYAALQNSAGLSEEQIQDAREAAAAFKTVGNLIQLINKVASGAGANASQVFNIFLDSVVASFSANAANGLGLADIVKGGLSNALSAVPGFDLQAALKDLENSANEFSNFFNELDLNADLDELFGQLAELDEGLDDAALGDIDPGNINFDDIVSGDVSGVDLVLSEETLLNDGIFFGDVARDDEESDDRFDEFRSVTLNVQGEALDGNEDGDRLSLVNLAIGGVDSVVADQDGQASLDVLFDSFSDDPSRPDIGVGLNAIVLDNPETDEIEPVSISGDGFTSEIPTIVSDGTVTLGFAGSYLNGSSSALLVDGTDISVDDSDIEAKLRALKSLGIDQLAFTGGTDASEGIGYISEYELFAVEKAGMRFADNFISRSAHPESNGSNVIDQEVVLVVDGTDVDDEITLADLAKLGVDGLIAKATHSDLLDDGVINSTGAQNININAGVASVRDLQGLIDTFMARARPDEASTGGVVFNNSDNVTLQLGVDGSDFTGDDDFASLTDQLSKLGIDDIDFNDGLLDLNNS